MQCLHVSIVAAATGLLVLSASASAGVIYVDDDAPLLGDGQGWETAYTYLQDALAAAMPGDEIRVAQGTYWPDRAEYDPGLLGDRDATFRMLDDVTIMGGYAGRGAEDPDARDVTAFETILSGDLTGDDQPDFVNYDENSYHIVTADGVMPTAILDGFTIRAGFAEDRTGGGVLCETGSPVIGFCTVEQNLATGGLEAGTGVGAGLYFRGEGTPVLRELVIRENRVVGEVEESGFGAGAAFLFNSEPTLERCDFVQNEAIGFARLSGAMAGLAAGEGIRIRLTDCTFTENESRADDFVDAGYAGALSGWSDSEFVIERCTFEGNRATFGGAIWLDGGEAHFVDCEFRDNESYRNNVGYAGHGGALSVGLSIRLTVTRCAFQSNSAEREGGAIWVYGLSGVKASIANSTFAGNTAGYGGAVYLYYLADAKITNVLFAGNTAGYGGAVYLYVIADAKITNALFAGNQAEQGGAIYNYNAFPVLTNATFADNTATTEQGGGGMYSIVSSFPSARNSIFWGNTGGQLVDIGTSETTVDFCDVQDGWPGKGNIAVDAAFMDPENGDYRLAAGSPCIDAAHNNAVPADTHDLDEDLDLAERVPRDLDDNPRFANDPDTEDTGCGSPAVVDMGAYEFEGIPEEPVYVGDVTGDGLVTFDDLLEVLSAWGECVDECCLADVDFDADVGFDDLLLVLSNWS